MACYREVIPLRRFEQENGMPVDDVLRPVNSLHGALESAPVHAFRLWDVIADPALAADFLA